MKKAAIFLLLCSRLLHADLEDHFKKIDHPAQASPAHCMRNVDFIYMINLDQRPEKWKISLEQLAPYGIVPWRFAAVNGWELSLDVINDVGLKFSQEMEGGFLATSYHTFEPSHENIENIGQTYFVHCMPRGAIGCFLSHLSILQDAYDRGYETIWVLEDDIEVIRDPRILSGIIDALDAEVGKDNWDILYTDKDMRNADGFYIPGWSAARRPDITVAHWTNDYSMRVRVGEFYKIGCRYGTQSMIVRRRGMRKILQFFKTHGIYLPYDMDLIIPYGIKIYTVAEDVVGNLPKAPSDNGVPWYLREEK